MATTHPSAEQAMLPSSVLSSHDLNRPAPLAGPILVVVPHLRIGGAQKQAILLARKLKSSGHTVRIVLAGLERDRVGADYETLLQLGGFVRNDVLKTGNRFIDSLFLAPARAIRKAMGWLLGLARAVNPIPESHLFRLSRGVKQTLLSLGASLLPRRIRRTLNSLVQAYPEIVAPLSRKPSLVLRAYYLQRLLRSQQPSVVFSFLTQTNLATLIATFGQHIPVVVSERNDVARQPVSPHVAKLRLVLYQGARVVTANGPHSVDTMGKLFPKQKVLLLPNGFPSELKRRTHRSKQLGMLCRLEPQKNVDLVIRAFHNSGLGDDGWALSIHGEGPESKFLQTLIQALSLQQSVTLEGKTLDPSSALDEMDFLISASDYEGSSNVIHEAVAAGVIPLFAHTVDEAQHILSKKSVSELMFHKSVNGLTERFEGLDQLSDEYEALVGAVQGQFGDYWKSKGEKLPEILFHAGVARPCSQIGLPPAGPFPEDSPTRPAGSSPFDLPRLSPQGNTTDPLPGFRL